MGFNSPLNEGTGYQLRRKALKFKHETELCGYEAALVEEKKKLAINDLGRGMWGSFCGPDGGGETRRGEGGVPLDAAPAQVLATVEANPTVAQASQDFAGHLVAMRQSWDAHQHSVP